MDCPPYHVKGFFRSFMPKQAGLPHAQLNVVLRVFGWCPWLTRVQRKKRMQHCTIVFWKGVE